MWNFLWLVNWWWFPIMLILKTGKTHICWVALEIFNQDGGRLSKINEFDNIGDHSANLLFESPKARTSGRRAKRKANLSNQWCILCRLARPRINHTLGSAAWLVQELIKNSDTQPLGDEGDACPSKNLWLIIWSLGDEGDACQSKNYMLKTVPGRCLTFTKKT